MTKKPARPTYDTDLVFAVAVAVQRMNGSYVKDSHTTEQGTVVSANKLLVAEYLKDDKHTSIVTETDRTLALDIRQYWQGTTLNKLLGGKPLSDFDRSVMEYSNASTLSTTHALGVVAYLPEGYNRAQERENVTERIRQTTGEYLGRVGEKIRATVTVVKNSYSQQYNTNFVTAITADNSATRFSLRDAPTIGSTLVVMAKVKAHKDGTTMLHYTRVLR